MPTDGPSEKPPPEVRRRPGSAAAQPHGSTGISSSPASTPFAAPSRMFDAALDDLDGLIRRSRSLIVIDWRFNREVRSVIRSKLTGMTNGR